MLLHWLTKRNTKWGLFAAKELKTELNGVDKHMTCPIAEYIKKKEVRSECMCKACPES